MVKTLDENGRETPLGRFQDIVLCEIFRQEVKRYPNYRNRPVWVDVEGDEEEGVSIGEQQV